MREMFGPYVGGIGALRLNLGCAKNKLDGFLSLDLDARVDPDILHDLEITPLPFPEATFDCIMGSHVFEHIRQFMPLVADLYRILKPGGYLIAVTPHCGSDDAWDCPHHVRAFSENTWHHVSAALYTRDTLPHAGFGAFQGCEYRPWQIAAIALVPYPDVPLEAHAPAERLSELTMKRRFMRNVIQEVHAVLRKPSE